MRIVDSLPYPVREIEHAWIPLRDGARLSARIWLPDGAGRVPAIVEYIPYRKRDDTRWRDEPMHGYFAGHGYAAVRIDVRGSGTSDGVLADEYSDEEWSDALEGLRWIASRPWCDGGVGMIGKSWGGINALQLAALRPPELRCLITVCSSDDRWASDAHWMGGCALSENLTWGAVLQTLAMRPQDPELVGDSWRSTWLRRLAEAPLYAARWLRHATRDAYWARGSVGEDYSRIEVPVLAVGGWADPYHDTVPRLCAGLPGLATGLIGPWAHVYPHNGVPGPAIGFLQTALAWFGRWLGDGAGGPAGSGSHDPRSPEPRYRVWMSEGGGRPGDEPGAGGRWVAEEAWPSERIRVVARSLGDSAGGVSVPWAGTGALAAGGWCPFGLADLPGNQAPDDEVSVVMDLPALDDRLELLGAPIVELALSCDRPHAMVAVRLCDVSPDGVSARVTYGLLDLDFRDGFEERIPLEPGRRYLVRVPLMHCGHAFPAGHRIRVAVSTSYWPVAWPSAEPCSLRLHPGDCRVLLPERPLRAEDAELHPFPPAEVGPSVAFEVDDGPPPTRVVQRDAATGEVTVEVRQGWGPDGEPLLLPIEPIGLESGWAIEERFGLRPDEPASAWAEMRHVVTSARPGWSARLEVRVTQRGVTGGQRIQAEVAAWENGSEIFRRVIDEDVLAE